MTFGLIIYASVTELPQPFLGLMEQAAADLFNSPDWFHLIEREIAGPDDQLRYYAVSDPQDGRALALLPMVVWADRGGKTLSSLSNFYSLSYSPVFLLTLTRRNEILRFLAKELLKERPKWRNIDFKMLDSKRPLFREMIDAFSDAGGLCAPYFQFDNWFCHLNDASAEEYFASRPRRLINTINRKIKALGKKNSWSIDLYTDEQNIEAGMAAYLQVYDKSWKPAEGYPFFIPALMRMTVAKGMLRLAVLSIDGQPAAAQFWLVHKGTAVIYKLAHDEKFKTFSVGSILTKFLMRRVIDQDHVTLIDYGVGSEAYKQDWMTERKERWGLTVYNPSSFGGLARAAIHFSAMFHKRFRTENYKKG